MELTKHQTQVLVLAIGTAIEKEARALESLKTEARELSAGFLVRYRAGLSEE